MVVILWVVQKVGIYPVPGDRFDAAVNNIVVGGLQNGRRVIGRELSKIDEFKYISTTDKSQFTSPRTS